MMSPEDKEKLSVWLHRPKGSFAWVTGLISFVLLLSVTAWMAPAFDPLTAHPWMVLLLAASSMGIGVIVQHRYTLLVGKSIFDAGETGWRKKVGRSFRFARESNIALGIILLFGLCYPTTLYFAARSSEKIISACTTNLDARLNATGEIDDFPSISLPVCQCLAKKFLDKNGIVKLALFNTALLDVSDFTGVTETDESHCVDMVITSTPDLALRYGRPTVLPEAPQLDR